MPLASSAAESTSRAKRRKTKPASWTTPLSVIAEIKAYIAIRDELLAEAEQLKTRAKLDSAAVANDCVQSYLKPVRPPYQWQCLAEPDAVRERKRCDAVRTRIAILRTEIV